MMKLKKIKSKMVVGVLAVGVLGGVTFAGTNAGTQLRNWYNTQNSTVKTQVYSDFTVYADSKTPGIDEDVAKLKKNANHETAITSANEQSRIIKKINAVRDEYIGQIQEESNKIHTDMPGDYDNLITRKNESVNIILGEKAAVIQDEISGGVIDLTTGGMLLIKAVPELYERTATEQINQAIQDAKEAIEKSINDEKLRAKAALEENFDQEVDKHRTKINDETNALVEEGKAKFLKRGEEVEEETLVRLEGLLNKI